MMKILNIYVWYKLFKWIGICLGLYLFIKSGIPPYTICIFLLFGLAIRLVIKLVLGLIRIGFIFLLLWLLTLIF